MTDEATAAPADAAAVSDAPAPDAQPANDAPQTPPVAEPTARGAIDRAFAALDTQDKTPKEPAEQPKDGEQPAEAASQDRPRNPDGTFAPKDATAQPQKTEDAQKPPEEGAQPEKAPDEFSEPPSRFHAEAKQAWKDAPLPVRAEIKRAVDELSNGIQQYQEAFEPYKEFDRQLRQNGQSFQDVLSHYQGIENLLASEPLKGFEQIAQNMGTSFREVAERYLGRTPDENAAQQDATIRELRNELAEIKQSVTGVTKSIQSEKQTAVLNAINEFASKPEFGRFDELANDIVMFMHGRLNDKLETARTTGRYNEVLQEAYQLAERLNPAPQAPAPAAPAAQPPAQAQTQDKGNLSLSGAPSSGSNPANRRPPSTAKEAIDNAFAQVGI